MQELDVAAVLRETLWIVVKLGGPLLVVALIVGLVISLVQAVTQVNEATLVFLPKLLILFGVMALMGPFMNATMNDFMRSLVDRMVQIGGL